MTAANFEGIYSGQYMTRVDEAIQSALSLTAYYYNGREFSIVLFRQIKVTIEPIWPSNVPVKRALTAEYEQ